MPCGLKFVILLMKLLSDLQFPFILWMYCLVKIHCSISLNLQRNALQMICFAKLNDHATQLFRKMKIIKFVDLVSVENCIFINKCLSCKSYSVFSHLYNLAAGRHNHQTRFAMNGLLILPNYNTDLFGTKAFLYFRISSWNSFQVLFSEKNFRILSLISLKKLLKNYLTSLCFWEVPFLSSAFQL